MGKYSSVIDKLPRLPPGLIGDDQGPNRRTDLDAIKATVTDRSPSALVEQYARARRARDEAEKAVRQAGIDLEAMVELITEIFEGEGITQLSVKGIGSLSLQQEPYSHIEDKEEFRRWCLTQGLENQLSLPWMTANSLVKERLLAAEDVPPGVVAYVKVKAVLRKDK